MGFLDEMRIHEREGSFAMDHLQREATNEGLVGRFEDRSYCSQREWLDRQRTRTGLATAGLRS